MSDTTISRALSKTLRHKAKVQGFTISSEGWVPVAEILASSQYKRLNLTSEVLDHIVDTNSKKRFEFNDDKKMIRACQGHSLSVEVDSMELLNLDTLPPIVVHGTNEASWKHISESGLNRMTRQHIHMAAGLPGTVLSGMRNDSTVFVYIDGKRAMGDGIEFYKSSNGAILSPGRDGVIGIEYLTMKRKGEL